MLLSHQWLVCTVVALVCGIAPSTLDAQESLTDHATEQAVPRFTTLEVFGSAPAAGFLSINNRRMVVGTYTRIDGPEEAKDVGFALLDRFLHPIDFENARIVLLTGINDRGVIVGLVGFTDETEIGFRYSLGKLESINVPDASLSPVPQDINNKGDVVGWVQIHTPSVFGEFGFLSSRGRVTLFAAPDASRPVAMRPDGINDKGEIVGCYDDNRNDRRGFLLRNGAYTRIQVPEARSTCPSDINNHGTIVGGWVDAASTVHGFLLRHGRYTTIDIPNSISSSILSINDFGDIVGKYQDTSFREHGFKSNIREFIRLQ